jgi:hypothetical protein
MLLISIPLEHFQAKWEPVRRPEMRQLKEIERFRDSTQTESALSYHRCLANWREYSHFFAVVTCAARNRERNPNPHDEDRD